jgi:hypothetical protein
LSELEVEMGDSLKWNILVEENRIKLEEVIAKINIYDLEDGIQR